MLRASIIFSVLLVATLCAASRLEIHYSHDTIQSMRGPAALPSVLLLPGRGFPVNGYDPLMKKVLGEFQGNNITAVIGMPRDAGMTLAECMADMRAALDPRPITIRPFIIAHSSAVLQVQESMKNGQLTDIAGMVLLGSTLARDMEQKPLVPTLTIGGDLDGVTRVMRFAESFFNRIISPASTVAPLQYPVFVKQGVAHASFCAGPPPLEVKQRDLQDEVNGDHFFAIVASDVFNFIVHQFGRLHPDGVPASLMSTSLGHLTTEIKATFDLILPMIDALLLESSARLFPACGDLNDVDPTEPVKNGVKCWPGSAWSGFIQERMYVGPSTDGKRAGLELKGVHAVAQDEFHKAWIHFPTHLPEITTTCDDRKVKTKQCWLVGTSISQNIYDRESKSSESKLLFETGPLPFPTGSLKDWIQSSPNPSVSASEIRTKLRSRQYAHMKAGEDQPDFKQWDGQEDRCARMNAMAYAWALDRLGIQHDDVVNDEFPVKFSATTRQLVLRQWQYVLKHMNGSHALLNAFYKPASKDQTTDARVIRYRKANVPLTFGKDMGPYINGARWIWTPLTAKLQYGGESGGEMPLDQLEAAVVGRNMKVPSSVELRSPSMTFANNFIIKEAAGMHYCKLLSPARAMEWILTDALRFRLSSA